MGEKLSGYPIVFWSRSLNLGGFREQVAPSFPDRAIRERSDVRALGGHDPMRPFGRLSAGTLKLTKDVRGLRAEIDMPPTTAARDALESIHRGDTPGWSFAFTALEDSWVMDGDLPLRTLVDGEISEVSCACTWPAYPATEAASRDGRIAQAEAGTGASERAQAREFAARFRSLARRHPGLEVRVDYRGADTQYRVILSSDRVPYRPSMAMRRRQLQMISMA